MVVVGKCCCFSGLGNNGAKATIEISCADNWRENICVWGSNLKRFLKG